MNKRNENQFFEKFRYLHSQEASDDITWSCSDSSDYECCNIESRTLSNITNGIGRKRKRVKNKKKDLNNISNLNITIVDSNTEEKYINNVKSPILDGKSRSCMMKKSPILSTRLRTSPETINQVALKDCVLHPHDNLNVSTGEYFVRKSPIIIFKNSSPKFSPKVKKKLFKGDECHTSKDKDLEHARSTSPILSKRNVELNRKKYIDTVHNFYDIRSVNDLNAHKKYFNDPQINCFLSDRIKDCSESDDISIESIQCSSSEESVTKKSHKQLVANVKSYFDNHFSEGSQLSISEYETPTPKDSSKSSNEIDITTPKTQEIMPSVSKTLSINTFESYINTTNKKVKYKKGGLAYRLNALLKKQTSCVNLWQHERFLAANSNFVIPKQEFLIFRIKNVYYKYGIYLLEIVNKDDELFIILINGYYVNNNIFEIDSVLKIYEPFKIVIADNNCKIICNMCKFECEKLIQ